MALGQARVRGASAARARERPARRRLDVGTVLRHAVLIFFCVVAILPLIWIVGMSLKSVPETYRVPITLFPKHPTLAAYAYSLQHIPGLGLYFLHSVITTSCALVGVLVISSLAGFAFAWLPFTGKRMIFAVLVATMFFPTQITSLLGIYEVTDSLNLTDTLTGLILPYIAINLVVSTYIMTGVFRAVPKELQDAARVDGASYLRTFWQIMLPLARNGVVVVVMLNFIAIWGEFLLARTLTTSDDARTLTVAMAQATAGVGAWEWPDIAAVYMYMVVPPILLFIVVQRWFMRGLTEGALKL
jgi:ABC-type glycerol-3-phosphate transport system permease component